jgi:hypothetical protein
MYLDFLVKRFRMTSKKTITEKNLTTIQISKSTVQQLRRAESYPRETYDCIIARLVEVHATVVAKVKSLEAYPNEPVECIVARLVDERSRRISRGEQAKSSEKAEESVDKSGAAEAFQKELSKLTGQK